MKQPSIFAPSDTKKVLDFPRPHIREIMRAKELEAQAIDKVGDPTVHPEEHAQRRRRLTKGPEEFREVRVDRPKAKPR